MIRFDSVSFSVNSTLLINNVSFEIGQSESVVLLGESGSGKTTLLKLINHLLIPTSGSVEVFGKRTVDWNAISLRRKIGYVIQEVGLFPHYTVFQNVGLVPHLEGWHAERVRTRVAEVLELVGLNFDRFAARYPAQLSGGQRQRVGVARALCADPPILLLDEPFGALDPVTRSELQNEFRQLQQRLGKTMVFVTHDVPEALIFGDRIAFIQGGEMASLSERAAFVRSPDPAVKAFLQPTRRLKQVLDSVV